MARNRFTNPADATYYDWPINHSPDGEQDQGIERPIEHTATTGLNRTIRQQGAEDPMVLRYSGTILQQAQHDAFVDWARLSESQTIYFTDFAGNQYEVFITSFKSKREGVLANPRGGTDNPHHLWRFTLEMEVINVISGDWS